MSQRISGYERKEHAYKSCAHCGGMFTRNPKHGRAQWEAVRFCSVDCSNKNRSTHGQRGTRLYRVWAGIKNRCLNSEDNLFKHYGARGITICDKWKCSFEAFARDIGPDPGPEFEVGRIDNDLGYRPGNVRWETRQQNMRNKRSTRWVDFGGEKICLKELCERNRLPYKRTWRRLRDGWSLDRAINP